MEKVEKAKRTHGEKMEKFGKNMWNILISKDNALLFAIISTNKGGGRVEANTKVLGK